MIVGIIVGGAVVGAADVGGAVVGAADVGGAVVGAADVGGAVVGAADVGGAVVGWPGFDGAVVWPPELDGDPPELWPVVVDCPCAGGFGTVEIGAMHDTVYFAGLEAAARGLVTTSTTSPDAGSVGGVILSGGRVFVPARLKVTVRGADFCPSASAQ